MVKQEQFEVRTSGRGTVELTGQLQRRVEASGIETGIAQIFIHHTSASLMLCENADPDVRRDMETFLSRLSPDGDADFVHTMEGPDDMPAHVRSMLTGVDVSLPVTAGRLNLGTWQGVYLYEHRQSGHLRRLTLTLLGE